MVRELNRSFGFLLFGALCNCSVNLHLLIHMPDETYQVRSLVCIRSISFPE
jgi:hypothetical protein